MIKNFFEVNKKYSFTLLAIIISVVVWFTRETLLYKYLPNMIRNIHIVMTIFDIVLCAVLIAGCAYLTKILLCPPHLKRRFSKAVIRENLTPEGTNEYPQLVSVMPDITRRHGKIYKIKNNGVYIISYTEKVIHNLQGNLRGKIGALELSKNNDYILMSFMPNLYVTPTIIDQEFKRITQAPNLLVIGNTGSGKSYALMSILGIYAQIPDISITVCDYKKSSFSVFSDTKNFYGFQDVPNGIKKFYREFCERLEANDDKRNSKICVLLIDEYSSFISSRKGKEKEEFLDMITQMLNMSRSLGMRILLSAQRADAVFFKDGARDQFKQILAMGNLSREQKQMLFSQGKEQMTQRNGVGEGYLYVDGQEEIERIKVAEIDDFDAINENIRNAMCRELSGGADGEAEREPTAPSADAVGN